MVSWGRLLVCSDTSLIDRLHCCPVNRAGGAKNPIVLRRFGREMGGVDLNWVQAECLGIFPGDSHVQRQDAVRATDGFCAVDDVLKDCRALQRRSSGSKAFLRRTAPDHGVCATDLPGES